jgi:TOMM system kinase/cyclase fusion protein
LDQLALIHDVFQGRYEAGRRLGEGGFGQVYEARQIATGQLVAIKVLQLRQGKRIDTQIARFNREMRLCAELHHPHIVRLIDSGQRGTEVLCTVFEYVPGKTLAQVLREETVLNPREASHLMMQVLDALGCAHAAGVVHRDLKPHNIMITTTGVRRNAMVLDFGIGAVVEVAQLEELARLTKTNELLGTPAYAAPEQLRGLPPTVRSDLYSWALVFLECLTGEQAVQATNLAELLAKQSGPEPIEIPAWLRTHHLGRVLGRALVKDVERRIIDADELMRELERREVSGPSLDALARRNVTPGPSKVEVDDGTYTVLESFDLERHLLAGERRHVTALHCTLRLGGEGSNLDLRMYLGLFQATLRVWGETIRRFGGYFAGNVGSSFLFYFGYPVAKENDAIRACRCALEMIEVSHSHAARVEAELGVSSTVAIGIHSDMVVTQMLSSGPVYSDVIGLAAVVAEQIPVEPGTVVLSEATRRLLRRRFDLEPAGELKCSEVAEPIALHRLIRDRDKIGLAADESGSYEFVGRTHELPLLLHRWGLAARGKGQTILISADAGVGKTRLALELHRRLDNDAHRWLVCRCSQESRNSALQPIVELFEQLLHSTGVTPNEARRSAALERLLQEFQVEPESIRLIAQLLGISLDPERYPPRPLMPDRARELTIAAVVSFLLELSDRRPLLFLVEDVQWADPSTLTLLQQLFKDIGSSAACVILTARPDFESPPGLEFMTRVQLLQLSDDEVGELIQRLAGGKLLSDSIIRQITERADGVPLFVEELSQMLAANLADGDLGRVTPNVEIPTTLRDALMARLDMLGSGKRIAHIASALGREFSGELLREVAAEFGETDVDAQLDALYNAGLVTRKRRRGSMLYSFRHALVREVAHEAMLAADRKSVHGRIAAALERNFKDVVENRPDLLAMHWRIGGRTDQAIDYAKQAANLALMRSANLEAGAHVTEALTWVVDIDEPRKRAEAELDLNGMLTRVVMITQGYGAVDIQALVRRSEALIAELGSNRHVFPNLAAIGVFYMVRGNLAAALEHAYRLVALARETGDTSREFYGLVFLSQCLFSGGQFARQREVCERALALLDPVAHGGHLFEYGQDSISMLDGYLHVNLAITGALDESLKVAARVRARADQLDITHVRYGILFGLAFFHVYRRERDAIVAISDEARALAAAQGGSFFLFLIEQLRAWATNDHQALAGFVGMMRAMDGGTVRAYWCLLVADLDLERGELASGLEQIEWALAHADDGSRFALPEMYRIKAKLLAAQGQFTEAEAAMSQALAIARADGAKLWELRAAVDRAEMLRGRGGEAAARDELARLLDTFTQGRDQGDLVAARALLGRAG